MSASANITQLLIDWGNGDAKALEKLLPLVEAKLHHIAHQQLRAVKGGHTLQTTAIINETYLSLIQQNNIEWQNRAHFFGVASITMRQFLLNYIRNSERKKRGGKQLQVTLGENMAFMEQKSIEILALDEALSQLAEIDERKARVVEFKYFGGMQNEEIAEVLQISSLTVTRDWNMAKAWLAKRLNG